MYPSTIIFKIYDSSKEIFSLYTYRITGVGNDLNFKDRPVYVHEFVSGIGTWKLNKFIGENTLLNQEWIIDPKKKVKV